METKVTLFELIISCGGIIATIIGAWIHMRINVSLINAEMDYLKKEVENEKKDNKENYVVLSGKLDLLLEVINELKIQLARK